MKRIGTIDALRGLAAFAVCFYHLSICLPNPLPEGALKTVGSFGWLGVEVFFVISGFIIPYAMHRADYGLKQYGLFVLKRVIRLDPPYLATIALIIPLGYLAAMAPGYNGTPYSVSTSQVLLHFAYLNVFFDRDWLSPVFWTLAIEFQYYLLVGFLYPLIANRRLAVRLGVFAALGSSAFLLPNDAFIPHWFFLFMLGMLAFQRTVGLVDGVRFWVILTLLTGGAGFTLGPLIAAVGLAAACAIIFVKTSNPILQFFGAISYSLYLLHLPIGGRVVNLGSRLAPTMLGQVIILIIGLAASVAAAYLLYRFVEKPAQEWSSRIKYRRQTPVAEETSVQKTSLP